MSIDGSRKRVGRPPVGSTAINLRLPPDQLSAVDAWIMRHDPAASRPEALRTLVGMGLRVPLPPRKPPATAPFNIGDVIEHRLFGRGRVTGPITESWGPDMNSPEGVRHAGWSVGVEWDDKARGASRMGDASLRLVRKDEDV